MTIPRFHCPTLSRLACCLLTAVLTAVTPGMAQPHRLTLHLADGTDFSLTTRRIEAMTVTPSSDQRPQQLSLTLRDGQQLSWAMTDMGKFEVTRDDVAEVDFVCPIENPQVYRFLREVVYDPEDYEYTRIPEYATPRTDLDQPLPIVIRLEADSVLGGETVVTSPTPDFAEFKRQPMVADSAVIWNAIPGQTLHYRIYDADGTTVLQQGTAKGEGRLRMIYAPSVHNVRDMGGWPVEGGGRIRYGRLFRGAKLHDNQQDYVSADDILRLRDLGIAVEFDLRGGLESGDGTQASYYSRLGDDIIYCTTGTGVYAYMAAVKEYPEYFRYGWNRIKSYARTGIPIFFHCSMGCDRAGTWALILGGFLGMSENDLNLDYELSAFAADDGYYRVRNEHQTQPNYDFRETMRYIKSLPGETLQQRFDYFLRQICAIPVQDLNRFKAQMIEYPDDPAIGFQ